MGINDAFTMKLRNSIWPKKRPDGNIDQAVKTILNVTLADEAILCMKTRCALWNVRGAGFNDRHTLFIVQYNQLNDIADIISKRVRDLGGLAIASFEEFLDHARIDEQPGAVPEIVDLVADHETEIRFLGEDAKRCSEDYQDEVTHDLLVDILILHEKMARMLRAHIEPALTGAESLRIKIQPLKR